MKPAIFCACYVALAMTLHGCGGGGSTTTTTTHKPTPKPTAKPTPKPTPTPTSSVIVMRHCARTMNEKINMVDSRDGVFADFAAEKWPEWPMNMTGEVCVPQGQELIKKQGKWMMENGHLILPVRGIADASTQRDNDTMHHFFAGTGLAASDVSMTLDHGPFTPVKSPQCEADNHTFFQKLGKTQLEVMQEWMEDGRRAHQRGSEAALQKVFEVLGMGPAGNWTNQACEVVASRCLNYGDICAVLTGSCMVASRVTERFLMEWGAGLEGDQLGWGKLGPEEIPELMQLHAWWFSKQFGNPDLARVEGASLINVVHELLSGRQQGTTMLFGHDSDLMALGGGLGLVWEANPWPINSSAPGSMLRFDLAGDEVSVWYLIPNDYGSKASGEMLKVPATFGIHGSNVMTLDEFTATVSRAIFPSCAYHLPSQDRLFEGAVIV